MERLRNLLKFRWVGAVIIFLVVFIVIGFLTIIATFDKNNEQQKKVGFIILGDINEPGWNLSLYEGIKAACDEYDLKLLVRDNVKENSGQCPAAIDELVNEGAGLIILASYSYAAEVKDFVTKYPNVSFTTIATEANARNMTSHFIRIYQARYLSGVLAGMRTKSNVLGYVAAMPNSEVNRGINAFALGAQRVNPETKVVVTWTNTWQDAQTEEICTRRLIEETGADFITYHQDDDTVAKVAEQLGVDFVAYNTTLQGYSRHYLASIICHWDFYYMDIVQKYLKGELNSVKNNWLGINKAAVLLSQFSGLVTIEMRRKLAAIQQELWNDKIIFSGEIYDNQGNLRCGEGETISDDTLIERIDWLVKGVEVLE